MPRKPNKVFKELGFQLIKENASIGNKVKYVAFCFNCQIVLKNTAESKLKFHR